MLKAKSGATPGSFCGLSICQMALYALQDVQHEHGYAAERQHRAGVFGPAHLFGFIDARQAVDQLFDGAHDRIEESFIPIENTRHERAQRFCERQHNQQKEQDLEPAVVCHGQNFSGRSIAYTR